MSDYIIKIIPINPYYHIDGQKIKKIVDDLKTRITADNVELKTYDNPAFIDCGSNLEKITCPICGAIIDFDWWSVAMDTASNSSFMDLYVKLPCCGESSTLNDLQYYFPCGFSCTELNILNPLNELSYECLSYIQELLGTPIRCIQAHI
ncbi:MAG: hypothetical protein HDR19_04915 [Lachnospiraceae bacterium]|nr:hypothetical protein [Lachnospiraceae bacterium]